MNDHHSDTMAKQRKKQYHNSGSSRKNEKDIGCSNFLTSKQGGNPSNQIDDNRVGAENDFNDPSITSSSMKSTIQNQNGSSTNSNTNMVQGHQQMSSASFSTLWLPFKSPFRRPFFFAGNNKPTSNHTSFHSMMDDDGHRNVSSPPMASGNEYNQTTESYYVSQNSQHLPWLQQFALQQQQQQQKEQQQPISMTRLNQGDIPISPRSNGNVAFPTSDSSSISDNDSTVVFQDDAIVADIVDKCCGIVPPIFQTAVQNSEVSSFTQELIHSVVDPSYSDNKHASPIVERNIKKTVNGSKKKGFIPMRLNRRGRNDASLSTKEHQRHQELQRATHKKQRAAHQASSPSSYGSLSRPGSMDRSKSRDRDASPPPSVRCINGLKVTMIDDELKVFVIDLLTPETCELVRRMADEHVKAIEENGNNVATWRTLYTYTKKDLPCSEVKGLTSRVTDHIMSNVIDVVGEIYGKKQEATKLHPRSWKEPHLLLYRKFENEPPHTGVEMHYDGCDITWNCMLSKSTEYDGGGTYIRALRKTVRLEQGQVLVHPGELYHKGCDITRGERALIVCFMDGFNPHLVDPSSAQEDKEVYEKNIRTC